MGLFDYIKCNYKSLPKEHQEIDFQTKSLDSTMDNYEIDSDGQLYGEEYDTEDRSDPNAKGINRIIGMLTRTNIRKVKKEYTGEIVFYGFYEGYKNWIEYSSYFVKGELKHLERL